MDRRPPPDIRHGRVGLASYVDGVGVVGTDEPAVDDAHQRVRAALFKWNLDPGDDDDASEEHLFIGLAFDKCVGRISVRHERLWRIRLAATEMLARNRVSGHQLRRFLGHFTWSALLRREALSLVSTCYKFVEWAQETTCGIWAPVRRELGWIISLLPLLFADARRPWHPHLYAADASGRGVELLEASASVAVGYPLTPSARLGRSMRAGASMLMTSSLRGGRLWRRPDSLRSPT